MGASVDRAAWRELIDRLIEQKRRLVSLDRYESDTMPNPGATEEQLSEAEARLGRPLDPQYRELLSVANGWEHFANSCSLLGTDDIGSGPRWEAGLMHAEIWFDHNSWGDNIGAPNDPASFQLVVENDNGYSGNVFLFIAEGYELPTGAAVPLAPEITYPDLYSYVRNELDYLTKSADGLTLGEYSEPWWGRNIRTNPPTLTEILAKVAELARIVQPDVPSPLRPGAAIADLDELDNYLSGTLDPDHRELLLISNGVSTPYWELGHILSSHEILSGTPWREALARRQTEEDLEHNPPPWDPDAARRRVLGLPDPEQPAPVLERIGHIPAVPFALSHNAFYGIDTEDGCVRSLLDDGAYFAAYGQRPGGLTIREHLLKACVSLWSRGGRPDGPVE